MQFTEPSNPIPSPRPSSPWPTDFFPSKSPHLSSLANNAACMEQLLAHCAHAIDSHDATLAQQLLWVLHNIAPPDGDPNQRLASAFLRALLLRASRSSSPLPLSPLRPPSLSPLPLSPLSLAAYIDLTPFHRFGFSASNSAITTLTASSPVLHLVDLSTTLCMQLPTLIESLASRNSPSPLLRLTIPSLPASSASPPPSIDMPVDQLGARLLSFARSRNIPMEFTAVPCTPADGFSSLFDHLRLHRLASAGQAETLVFNCHLMLHYTPDETPRAELLKSLRSMEPAAVILVEEDADFTARNVVDRLKAAFEYMWIPFDAADSFLPRGGEQRSRYEAAVCWKIENVIANEGEERVERLETRTRWGQRMRSAGFRAAGFGEDAVGEVRGMLDEHSAGWGMKRDDDDLVLTWKGHDVVFASAWIPATL